MGAAASAMPDAMDRDQLLEAAGPVYGPALFDKLKDAEGMVAKDKLIAISKKTDVFLSHDWGKDEEGRANHDRVARINAGLQALGLVTWFDSERMEGDIVKMMCNGIENASVIAVFVTKNYIDKVNSDNGNDNCQQEFMYAKARKSPKLMLPIVMEKGCRKTSDWIGPVCMTLGNTLYIDCAADSDEDRAVKDIAAAVAKKVKLLLAPDTKGGSPTKKASKAVMPAKPIAVAVAVAADAKPLEDLSTAEVVALFHSLKLGDSAYVIEEQAVTGEMLKFAEKEDDLKELGLDLPSIKLKMLLSKLTTFKQRGVPLADLAMPVEAVEAEAVEEGNQEAEAEGEYEDPTSEEGLVNSYHTTIHEHTLFRNRDDNGWGCDGRNQDEGCVCGCEGFYETAGWVKFTCSLCNFDLCRGCTLKWSDGQAEENGGDLASAEVSIHNHALYRDYGDNGWGCDGRNQEGGCRGGCTGFGQTGGWERYRCAGCNFDLCRACVDEFSTTG